MGYVASDLGGGSGGGGGRRPADARGARTVGGCARYRRPRGGDAVPARLSGQPVPRRGGGTSGYARRGDGGVSGPDGPSADEMAAFDAASAQGTAEGWEAFIATYPASALTEAAQIELAALAAVPAVPAMDLPARVAFDEPLTEVPEEIAGRSIAELIQGRHSIRRSRDFPTRCGRNRPAAIATSGRGKTCARRRRLIRRPLRNGPCHAIIRWDPRSAASCASGPRVGVRNRRAGLSWLGVTGMGALAAVSARSLLTGGDEEIDPFALEAGIGGAGLGHAGCEPDEVGSGLLDGGRRPS